MYIILEGNLTEGFTAYGPYDTFGDASDAHDSSEGWIMEVNALEMQKVEDNE